MIRPLDLMEPEETVGNLWHDWASRSRARRAAGAARRLRGDAAERRHALPRPRRRRRRPRSCRAAAAAGHRRSLELGMRREMVHVADFDGAAAAPAAGDRRLPGARRSTAPPTSGSPRWPPASRCPSRSPTRSAPTSPSWPPSRRRGAAALAACPGLGPAHAAMRRHLLAARARRACRAHEAAVEARVRALLGGEPRGRCRAAAAPRGYRSFAPVPVLLRLGRPGAGRAAASDGEAGARAACRRGRCAQDRPARGRATRRTGATASSSTASRRSCPGPRASNVNRTTDDDEPDNARKAAEDQDHITLSEHFRRAASRLRLSLDLVAAGRRARAAGRALHLPGVEPPRPRPTARPLPRARGRGAGRARASRPTRACVARVRRQFAPLHPRRVLLPRQPDGDDLDLDAAVRARRSDLRRRRPARDRVWQAPRRWRATSRRDPARLLALHRERRWPSRSRHRHRPRGAGRARRRHRRRPATAARSAPSPRCAATGSS